MANTPLLTVRRLCVHYSKRASLPWQPATALRVVENINFNLYAGETLGIVGESGSGKSTLARTLAGLQASSSGAIHFGNADLAKLSENEWRPMRRHIQMVFQDPLASLDPRMNIFRAIEQPLIALCPELDANARKQRIDDILSRVGLDTTHGTRYPHELSGGQCQRVGLARALVVQPKLLICDEPVSALDVSVQAQVINLLAQLQAEMGLTLIFIAHDLAVVRKLAQRVIVLYAGRVMEQGSCNAVFRTPSHPYTQALMAAIPDTVNGIQAAPAYSDGDPPDPSIPLMGCAYLSRCPLADDYCVRHPPALRAPQDSNDADHHAGCHFGAATSLTAHAALLAPVSTITLKGRVA